jgi:putative ABC transport system permease protein
MGGERERASSTVTALMTEQMQIIGLLKALGGTRFVIMRSYLISTSISAITGTLGGIGLGVPVGYAVAVIVARNTVIRGLPPLVVGPVMVTPGVIALSLFIGLAIPCGAALFPLWQGTRITVREAMSTYGLSSVDERAGRAPSRERARLSRSMNWVPQLFWFGFNSIMRRRGRAALAILALSCAGALFLAVTTPIYALYQQVRDYYAAYHFDVRVYLHQPERYPQLQQQLLAVPNVQHVERGSRQQVSTSWGILDLQEVEASTHVYHPQLLSGRWFLPNELDVLLLNDTAANIMQRTVGETLTFMDKTVRPGHATTWTIIGIVHDDSVARGGLGVAITTPENFHRFYGLAPDEVDGGILVQSRQHDPPATSMLVAQFLQMLNQHGTTAGVVSFQDFTRLTLGPRTQFQLALFYVVSAFVALISLFTLIMVQLRSVMERKREIGIMRALGARGWQVAIVFWVEGGSEGMIAWVIAILFSVPAAYGFLQLFLSNAVQSYVPFAYDTGFLPVMLAIILAIVMLGSAGPIRRAARMQVKELLRYE